MKSNQPTRTALPVLMALILSLIASARPATAESIQFVIEAARDTTSEFVAMPLAKLGAQALAWPEGVVTVPDSLEWLDYGEASLAFTLDGSRLVGAMVEGIFAADPGRYDVDTPIQLSDGRITACLTAGEIEVKPGLIIYRRPHQGRDPRADFMIVGGLVLATAVLLHGVRRRTRRS